MGIRRSSFLAAATITLQLLTAHAALAVYDMSGKWRIVESNGRLDITQTDGDLYSPIPTAVGGMFGTINEDTGSFYLESYGRTLTHSPIWFKGSVAPDGMSFTATYGYSYITGGTPTTIQTVHVSYPRTGTRCGNGDLDAGEECDDNNGVDGDCCSSTCTFEVEGATCASDDNQCTFDVCDGAGTCGHVDHTGACTDPSGCGTGTCASGSCVITTPAAAGTSCDRDASACTLDTCDDSGICTAGAALDCSPCGICEPAAGCVVYDPEDNPFNNCHEDPERASLSIRTDVDSRRGRLSLTVREPAEVPDLEDTTSYTICVFEEGSTSWPPLYTATIPAGGTCNDHDCWKTTSSGFLYKDGSASTGGVTTFAVNEDRGFKLKGKGANLDLPVALPTSDYSLRYRVQANGESTSNCWRGALDTDESSATEYKGSFVDR